MPCFQSSVVLVLVDHFLWFQYFARHYYSFMTIASFFGICVWMVPFAYFISLSANDNALPSFDKSQENKQKKNGILKNLFGSMLGRKDSPALVKTPKHEGFASSSLGPNQFNPTTSPPFRPDHPISRPSSSNSNHGHGHQSTRSGQNSSYAGQQPYASGSAMYSHSASTVASRF